MAKEIVKLVGRNIAKINERDFRDYYDAWKSCTGKSLEIFTKRVATKIKK